jgi:hypothetical protein
VLKGYVRADFTDAWSRYLTDDASAERQDDNLGQSPIESATAATPLHRELNGHRAANAAYTAGLCRDCGERPPSAGRPRCDECHRVHRNMMAGYDQ